MSHFKTICKNHEDAIKKIDYIREIISKTQRSYQYSDNDEVKDLLDTLGDIETEIDDVEGEILEAKDSGQKMEGRLREYRDAIENLGFVKNEHTSQQL